MTGQTKDCTGCAYTTRRLKYSQPRLWCNLYHRMAPEQRCIDYRTKRTAATLALDFFKRMAGK